MAACVPGALFAVTLPVTSGLKLWLAADSINTADATQVNLVNGTYFVKAWRDLSGGGFDAVQAASDRQPSYVASAANGYPVLKFDGINDVLATSLPQISGDKSIFIVHKRINLSMPSGTEISTSTGNGMFLGNNGGTETQGRVGIAHDVILYGLAGEYILKGFIRSGPTSTLYVNDSVNSTSTVADAATGNYTISDANYFPYSGAITEVLIYNRALSEVERQAVENYLCEKWGLWTNAVPVRAGLEMWLSADAISFTDASQVISRYGGYYLSRWQGRSLTGRNAVQDTILNQPQVVLNALNGRPVVRFDGVSDVLTTALPQISGNKTIFSVLKRSGTTNGMEVSSAATANSFFLGSNGGTSEAKGRFTTTRSTTQFDLQVPQVATEFILKSFRRSGTTEKLQVNDTVSTATVASDVAASNYTISDPLGSPFKGDLAELLIYSRAATDAESNTILDYLQSKYSWTRDNVYSVPEDSLAPTMTTGTPAPGVRVKQTVPAYAATNAYHTLYLPTDWQAGRKYPVIVEYPPNGPFTTSYADSATGKVDDISMGYGLTAGRGYILVGMPMIGGSPLTNQPIWWGDVNATKDYCLQTVRSVCEQYGGDPGAVILAGFSRGAIACNYLGLNDDTIADIWLAFIPHAHYDGQYQWGYAQDDAASALVRLNRLRGRAQHISHEIYIASPESYLQGTGIDLSALRFRTLPYGNHTDLWTVRPLQLRRDTRAWMQQILQDRPGTHSISGRVTNSSGTPLAGVRIQSGYTHFTFTAVDGTYSLGSIIDSARTVSASGTGTFTDQGVTVAGSNVANVNFQAAP